MTHPPQRPDLTAMPNNVWITPGDADNDLKVYSDYEEGSIHYVRAAIAEQTAPVEPQAGDDRMEALEWIEHRPWGYWTDTPNTETKRRVTETIVAALSARPAIDGGAQ